MTEEEIKEIGKISVEVESAIWAYLQHQKGFEKWWESLSTKTRINIGFGIAKCTFEVLAPLLKGKE